MSRPGTPVLSRQRTPTCHDKGPTAAARRATTWHVATRNPSSTATRPRGVTTKPPASRRGPCCRDEGPAVATRRRLTLILSMMALVPRMLYFLEGLAAACLTAHVVLPAAGSPTIIRIYPTENPSKLEEPFQKTKSFPPKPQTPRTSHSALLFGPKVPRTRSATGRCWMKVKPGGTAK